MALGLMSETGGGNGDILPIIKFDAKAGDFIKVDRAQNASGEWEKNQSEMALPIQIVMDFDNIETGWLSFDSGAPDFRMVKIGEAMPAKPSENFKQAFRVRIYNKDLGLREFSSQSKLVIKEMDGLHNQFEAERGNNAGKVPVVTVSGTKTVTVNTPQGEGRFKVPEWSVTSWIDRPAGMDGAETATPVEAPSAPVQSAPVESGSDLF